MNTLISVETSCSIVGLQPRDKAAMLVVNSIELIN